MNVDVRHYCIHGMRLSVTCEAASLIECVDAVLRPFAVPELKGAAFTFRMRLGTPSDRTPGTLRQTWSGTLPGGLFSVYWAGDDLRQIDLPGIAQLRMDLARRQATLTVKPGAERYVEYGCITPMVYTFLRQVGQHVVHAASLSVRVGRRRRAILLSGLSGLGKTTTAIALAHAGMSLMADDTSFVIRPDGKSVEGLAVWGLPRPCKVHVTTFDLLPWLNDLPRRPARTEDEFLIDLRDVSGGDSLQTASPGIVLFLEQRCDGEHAITPVDKMTAVGRLARENVRAVDKRAEGAAGDAFRTLVKLIDLSDTYLLSVGPRLDNLYEKIIGLLGG